MSTHLASAVATLGTLARAPSAADLERALAAGQATFRDSDASLLAGIAAALLAAPPPAQAMAWAERLLVFVEVRRTELWTRLRDKWPRAEERLVGALALEAVLLAASAATRDLRFLNTSLKLADTVILRQTRLAVSLRSPRAPSLAVDRDLRRHVEQVVAGMPRRGA